MSVFHICCHYSYHGEHRIGAVGARVNRGLGRRAGAHDHDFRHCATTTAAAGRFEIEPSYRGRQKIAVPPAAVSSMLSSGWLRLRCIPRITRGTPQTATSGRRLATPRAPLQQLRIHARVFLPLPVARKSISDSTKFDNLLK